MDRKYARFELEIEGKEMSEHLNLEEVYEYRLHMQGRFAFQLHSQPFQVGRTTQTAHVVLARMLSSSNIFQQSISGTV